MTLSCPVSFHGPYVNIEVTIDPDTEEQKQLITNYTRVFDLAARYGVKHVVCHYSQLQFTKEELVHKQECAKYNMSILEEIARQKGVNCLIENLCKQKTGHHLFSNEEYEALFKEDEKRLCLIDIGHAFVNELNLHEFIPKYRDRIKGYHFHNNDGLRDAHNHIFDGKFNCGEVMKLVKEYTPDAGVVLEYEPHTGLSITDVLEHIEFLKQC